MTWPWSVRLPIPFHHLTCKKKKESSRETKENEEDISGTRKARGERLGAPMHSAYRPRCSMLDANASPPLEQGNGMEGSPP